MLKYILAILIFGFIIFFHEFGHFIAAKLFNVKVLKFAVGMGPKLIGKTIGETEYSIRVFPLGGFCAMAGEDTDAITKHETSEAFDDSERSLKNKPRWQRFIILAAGPFMNVFLGFILAVVITCMLKLVPTTVIKDFHTVSDTDKTICAASAEHGLCVGDEIKKINGMRIFTTSDLSYQLMTGDSKEFDVEVERNDEDIKLHNVEFHDSVTDRNIDFYIQGEEKNIANVLSYSFKNTISTARLIWISLGDLISGKYSFKDMSGPIGVVTEIGKAASSGETAKESIMSIINLTMFITVNLGIMNLLPNPGLDGGQILFLLIEAIRRKPIKPEHQGIVNLIGLGLVMLLIIAITFSDITKLIG